MPRLSQTELALAVDRTVVMMRKMLDAVRPDSIGMKAFGFGPSGMMVVELRMATPERNWDSARECAKDKGWDHCVIVAEVWREVDEPKTPGEKRGEGVLFVGEAPGCKPEVRDFPLMRSADDAVQIGDPPPQGSKSLDILSRFGPLFVRPESN